MIQKLKEAILLTAEYYGRQLRLEIISMYANDFEGYEIESVIAAYAQYRKNPKNMTFPLPAQIKQILTPELSHDAQANEIASQIRNAIGKFGWCNANEARAHIGEIGWEVVNRAGGWSYICENLGLDLNQLTFHAQARDLAKSILETKKISIQQNQLGYSSDMIKTLDFKMREIQK